MLPSPHSYREYFCTFKRSGSVVQIYCEKFWGAQVLWINTRGRKLRLTALSPRDLGADHPLVSVVIPTFNRPDATRRAIYSAMAQSYRPIEIVVVDDASSPAFHFRDVNSSDIKFLLLRHDMNLGAAAARQAGIDASHGIYVAFLDSDDYWLPQKLTDQMRLIRTGNSPMLAISCGWVAHTGPVRRQRIPMESTSLDDFASGCWFCPGSTVILSREALDKVGPLDRSLRRLEDFEWFLRFGVLGGTLKVAPIVGTVISVGRRGKYGPVSTAIAILRNRYMADPRLSRRQRRHLLAYLQLERSAAARNEGRMILSIFSFVASLAQVPRLGIPLKRWWSTQTRSARPHEQQQIL